MKTYYIPVKSVNLGHYFNKACICPVIFLHERNEDIQNLFNEYILLSSEKYVNDSNCSIEIVLTDEERSIYTEKLSDTILLFKLFIPITRIVKIYFNSTEQGEKTIWNIEQGRAFVPKNIVYYDYDSHPIEFNQDIATKNFNNEYDVKNKTNLEKFNRLLGGFALMRLGGEPFMNYSINYFSTLSNINSIIKKEFENATIEKRLPVKNKFDWLIFNNKSDLEELYNLTYSNVTISDAERFASNNNARIDRKLGKINLDALDSQNTTFLVAILASYSDLGARLTIDNFISDLVQNKFPITRREEICLMFGINKGYEAFRNIYSTDKFEKKIKFEMNSPIDYYVIESIYQFILNNKISEKFSYLESFMPSSIDNLSYKKYKTYSILNCDVIYEKKPETIREVISSFLNRLFITDLTNPLVKNFQKSFGLNLTKEQLDYKNKEYEEIIKEPISNYIDSLRLEIEKFHEDTLIELKSELSKSNNERQKLSEFLKTIDNDAFIELDNDQDNQLSFDQTAEFINNLKLKPVTESSSVTNIEKPKSNSSEDQQSEKIGDLFANQDNLIKSDDNTDQGYSFRHLSKLGITALRKEATKQGIKSVSSFSNTPDDKERLIKLILKKEKY